MSIAASTRIDPRADPEAWKADRRNRITATDAAAIVGKHPCRTPLDVYLDKLGLAPEVEESQAMRWGTLLEGPILAEYSRITGEAIAREQVYAVHPGRPWQAATLDALTESGRVVEVKTIGLRSPLLGELGPEGTDEVPTAWLVQVQHQLAVTGRDEADVAALVGGQELRLYRVGRNDALIERLTEREEAFWSGHVLANVPPAVTAPSDADALRWLHPERSGEVAWDDAATLDLVDEYERLGIEVKLASDRRKLVQAQLKALLGSAERATTTDGRVVTCKVRTRAGYQVKESTFDDFRVRSRRDDV